VAIVLTGRFLFVYYIYCLPNTSSLIISYHVPLLDRDVHSLVINSVCHGHSGVYKCIISNKVGKAACYAHLYVAGKMELPLIYNSIVIFMCLPH